MFGLFGEDEEELQQPAPAAAPMDPKVKDYLVNKYQLGPQFSDKARADLVAQNAEEASGPNWMAGLSAFGAGMQGRDAGAAGANYLAQQKASRDSKIAEFDKGRAQALQSIDVAKEEDMFARENDPTSQESKIAQEIALSMGMSPEQASQLSAAQFKKFSPALEMKYKIAQNAEDRKLDRDFKQKSFGLQQDAIRTNKELAKEERASREAAKSAEIAAKEAEKTAEKEMKLKTPYGLANTEDDAKRIKEGYESKKIFDKKIQEMIALREKHGGGTNRVINSEDVERGEQLAKDLLLEYKNMAKLGVLSQSDEAIINKIIPKDPLAYRSVGSTLTGQDPILNNLKKFKEDSDVDFATKVSTRTRDGGAAYAASNPSTKDGINLDPAKAGGEENETRMINGKLHRRAVVNGKKGWAPAATAVAGE